jgi:hypothetical protein
MQKISRFVVASVVALTFVASAGAAPRGGDERDSPAVYRWVKAIKKLVVKTMDDLPIVPRP